jgi:hypothetical protein
MGTGDRSSTERNRENNAAVRCKGTKCGAGPDYIGDGIIRPDLMEVSRFSVDFPLCPFDSFKNPDGHGNCLFRGTGTVYPVDDLIECPPDRPGTGLQGEGSDSGPVHQGDLRLAYNGGHCRHHGLPVCTKMQESGGYHIPGSATEGIEDEQAHKSTVLINPCVYDF